MAETRIARSPVRSGKRTPVAPTSWSTEEEPRASTNRKHRSGDRRDHLCAICNLIWISWLRSVVSNGSPTSSFPASAISPTCFAEVIVTVRPVLNRARCSAFVKASTPQTRQTRSLSEIFKWGSAGKGPVHRHRPPLFKPSASSRLQVMAFVS